MMSAVTAYLSALDMFSIGIGPSSSHTVGPMRAARRFAQELGAAGHLDAVTGLEVILCGSLGATGEGHGTPDAVVAGLMGMVPETCDPEAVIGLAADQAQSAGVSIRLAPLTRLPGHPNGMRFTARGADGDLADRIYYSVGGGFVASADELSLDTIDPGDDAASVPHPFCSAAELLAACERHGLTVGQLTWANETALRPAEEVGTLLDGVWEAMSDCVDAGLQGSGFLPGGLRVRRRAAAQRARLEALDARGEDTAIEWIQAYAMAVNEENAAGRRVVTAPTNGAAGIVPAVGRHFLRSRPDIDRDANRRRAAMRTYLLTAATIGALYKRNASISGAEAGCQGEVGSACSMAAGGLCALLGGTPAQVENAAEIAMEHNLGLTCDPVGGLVQVPCIERNAIAACTAVSAARLALQGDGSHVVSLDTVIETMRQTGLDMSTKYKETSTGGLAVNVVEC